MVSRLMMCLIMVAAISGIAFNDPVQAQPSRFTQEDIDKFVQKYFSEENLQNMLRKIYSLRSK